MHFPPKKHRRMTRTFWVKGGERRRGRVSLRHHGPPFARRLTRTGETPPVTSPLTSLCSKCQRCRRAAVLGARFLEKPQTGTKTNGSQVQCKKNSEGITNIQEKGKKITFAFQETGRFFFLLFYSAQKNPTGEIM